MIKSKIKPLFDTISSSVHDIGNESLSGLCSEAGNLLENLSEENSELKKEIQKLRDEINKLKG
jgi:gas vesicle protein